MFVVNRSAHDFDAAKDFGDLVFLSEGVLKRFDVNNMARIFAEKLKDSHPEDYLVQTGLTSMNIIAAAMLAYKHGRLNLLLHKDKDRRYICRTISFGGLL